MTKEITAIISLMRTLCQSSIAEGEFNSDHNKELAGYCDVLSTNPDFDTWAPLLFEFIEEFDEQVGLDLGSPSPLISTLEANTPKYKEYLLQSMHRKPTGIALWMADRIARLPGKDKDFWLKKIKDTVNHPEATTTAILMSDATDITLY